MGIAKGRKLVKYSDEVLSRRILMRALALQDAGKLPTIKNIGAVGCNRDRILRLRNLLIHEGHIVLPVYKSGMVIRQISIDDPETADDPGPQERKAIEERMEELQKIKRERPDIYRPLEIKVCRCTLKNTSG
jgi:hypothetical protein